MQKFIQIGITALRDPATGDFLPAVPLYIEATADATQAETTMINDIGRVFAEKMKQYIDGGGVIERAGSGKGRKK
jgi:hypothetical protein